MNNDIVVLYSTSVIQLLYVCISFVDVLEQSGTELNKVTKDA